MRISDWSSDVCSSDLFGHHRAGIGDRHAVRQDRAGCITGDDIESAAFGALARGDRRLAHAERARIGVGAVEPQPGHARRAGRSEEDTSELQSLMRISYAVFCLKKKKKTNK